MVPIMSPYPQDKLKIITPFTWNRILKIVVLKNHIPFSTFKFFLFTSTLTHTKHILELKTIL